MFVGLDRVEGALEGGVCAPCDRDVFECCRGGGLVVGARVTNDILYCQQALSIHLRDDAVLYNTTTVEQVSDGELSTPLD